jgi:hypothetical protein
VAVWKPAQDPITGLPTCCMITSQTTSKTNTELNSAMNLKEKKALLKKLENAYNTCFDCGKEFGVYSVGCSSVYESKCDVCEQIKPITETRDFAFFITGIRKLKLEIQNEKSNRKTEKQKSEEQTLQCDG